MQATWFDHNWFWIGTALAVALAILLFATDVLRSDTTKKRTHDLVWLAWLGMACYLLHNIEEYGIAFSGMTYAFPASMNVLYSSLFANAQLLPDAFYTAVNVPLFWIAAPLLALIGRKKKFATLAISGIILLNVPSHLIGVAASGGYSPGVVTAVALFLPYGIWTLYVARRECGFARKATVLTFVDALVNYAVLMGSMMLYVRGAIPPTTLVGAQLANAAILIALPLLWEAVLGKRLYRRDPSAENSNKNRSQAYGDIGSN